MIHIGEIVPTGPGAGQIYDGNLGAALNPDTMTGTAPNRTRAMTPARGGVVRGPAAFLIGLILVALVAYTLFKFARLYFGRAS